MVSSVSTKDQLMHRIPEVRTYVRGDSVVFCKTTEAYGGLSNMAAGFPVCVNGVRIRTSEALYQACRFPHMPDVQRLIIDEASPMTAKMRSKPYRKDSRADWERVRVKVMRWCLRVKLSQNWNDFSRLLLATGDRAIVEESRKDDFWGAKVVDTDTLTGMNVLGRLLMELREEIKQRASEHFSRVEPLALPNFLLFQQAIAAVEGYPTRSAVASKSSPTSDLSVLDKRAKEGRSALIEALRPYSEYQESGLPWVGRMPIHWQQRRMKVLFRERVAKGFPGEPLLAATQTKGVIRKEEYGSRTVTAQKDLHLLKLVEAGDFVISLRSFEGGIEVAHSRGIISPAYTILEARPEAQRGFYSHFFKSPDFIRSLALFVTGIREGQNIDYERMSRAYIPLPSTTEQESIGRFLDFANRQMDQFIRAKNRVIKLLSEQKQVIINRAVTRGLDASVSLKPSGVPWVGEIPAHWEVLRAKYLFREVDERSATGNEELLSVSHITGVTPRSEKNITMFKASSYVGHKLCRFGDLVINTMWAWMAALGVSTRAGIVSPAYAVYRPKYPDRLVGAYLDGLLRTTAYVANYMCRSTGIQSSRLRLYPEEFFNVRIVVPPASEQREIVAQIKRETADLDTAILRTEREIELIREYRKRLIGDVVTGKLDVREAAGNLPVESRDLATPGPEEEPLEEAEMIEDEQIA